jgi:hypothetical protein
MNACSLTAPKNSGHKTIFQTKKKVKFHLLFDEAVAMLF